MSRRPEAMSRERGRDYSKPHDDERFHHVRLLHEQIQGTRQRFSRRLSADRFRTRQSCVGFNLADT